MERLTHDDGSLRLTETRTQMQDTVTYFTDKSSMTETEQTFVDLIEHTMGTPIRELTDAPFDQWMDTIVGADERISRLGVRLNELSEEVAENDKTYATVYQDETETIFSKFEDATHD